MHANSDNGKQLFERMAVDGEAGFAAVFHTYNERLFPFICKITKSDIIAEELVQEVFIRLWVNREEVAVMENPVGWLYRVAANLSLSYLRQLVKQHVPLAEAGEVADRGEAGVVDALGARELAQLVERAVSALPRRRQEIFRLSRTNGLNHKEIAAALQLSQNTVKDQLVISLKFIKTFIQKETGITIPVLLLISLLEKKF